MTPEPFDPPKYEEPEFGLSEALLMMILGFGFVLFLLLVGGALGVWG